MRCGVSAWTCPRELADCFLSANAPSKALKTTLKAEIDADRLGDTQLRHLTPLPPKPANGRFAVKVINHLGDKVMKVFRVG